MAINNNLLVYEFNDKILFIHTESNNNLVINSYNINNILNQNLVTVRLHNLTRPNLGNIYYCQIIKFQQSLNCFLISLGNNHYALLKNNKQTLKILNKPTIGQKFIGIIIKEGSSTKYPIISPKIILEGLLCDFKPFCQDIKFSPELNINTTKLENFKKNFLNNFSNKFGLTIKSLILPDLLQEIEIKIKLWNQIINNKYNKPGLIYFSYIANLLYENFSTIPNNIIINSLDLLKVIKEEISNILPFIKVNIIYNNNNEIFLNYISQLEEIISDEYIVNNEITLHFYNTKALNFIDIDFKGISTLNKEEALFKANTLSINSIVNLIKLRNLSGQIFIDTLKIKNESNKSLILKQYKETFKKFNVNAKIMGFTKLGVLEIERTKKYNSINDSIFQECNKCYGSGSILNHSILHLKTIMKINQIINKNPLAKIIIKGSETILKDFKRHNSKIVNSLKKDTLTFIIDNNLINTIIVY